MQFLPSTWRMFSNIVYGEVRDMTPTRERFVATKIIKSWLEEGLTPSEVALRWNQGHEGACSSGTNSKGVYYNSCSYRDKVLNKLAQL